MTEHKLVSREEWLALGALAALAAAAWLVTADRMEGMDAGPATDLGGLGWFVGVWATMMAAMMLPAAAPAFIAYTRTDRRSGGVPFVAGYLLAWTVAGLAAYAVVDGARSLDLGFLAWDEAGRYVTGAGIVVAGLYQLTRPKQACLRHCREPTVIRERWRAGRIGALRMGLEHGGLCIGCCWAMMVALFALGVMSVGWMALIAIMIAAERLLPWRAAVSGGVALVLVVIGIAVLATPEEVPGLTVPGTSADPMMEMDSGGDGSMGRGAMQGME
jgi:predicted metal-binding membrane protein